MEKANKIKLYFLIESTNFFRYWIEQITFMLIGWIPSLVGIGLRALVYRILLDIRGLVVIQSGVILKRSKHIILHKGVFIDHGAYLHAMPNGIEIGANTRVMFNAELHVFNFRNLPNAGIKIGENSVIGPFNIVMGHGGTKIGNNVIIAPRVSILPINHNYNDFSRPIKDQGVNAKGIIVEDDVWIGHGATILDGVRVGRGSVVGAGAIVAKDVPAYSMVVGTPAKVIKTWEPDKTNTPKDFSN